MRGHGNQDSGRMGQGTEGDEYHHPSALKGTEFGNQKYDFKWNSRQIINPNICKIICKVSES